VKNKIYLVIGGEYSDWFIDSYFVNRDEAEKYCFVKNKNQDSELILRVQKVPLNSAKMDFDKIQLKKWWKVSYVLVKGKWLIREIYDDYILYSGERKETTSERYNFNRHVWFIKCTADTWEQAKKIANDLIVHVSTELPDVAR